MRNNILILGILLLSAVLFCGKATIDTPAADGATATTPLFQIIYSYIPGAGDPASVNCVIVLDGTDVATVSTQGATSIMYTLDLHGQASGAHTIVLDCTRTIAGKVGAPGATATRIINYQPVVEVPTALNLVTPADASSMTLPAAGTPVTFSYQYIAGTYGQDPAPCELYLDGQQTSFGDASSGATSTLDAASVSAGSHTWYVACGPTLKSASRTFTAVALSDISIMTPETDGTVITAPLYDLIYHYTAAYGQPVSSACVIKIDGKTMATQSSRNQTGTVVHLDLSSLSSGPHTLTIECPQANGATAIGTRTFVYNPLPVIPTSVALITPIAGATVKNPIAFTFQYTAGTYGQGSPTLCDLYIDGQQAGSEYASTDPNTPATITAYDIPAGSHSYYVTCWGANSETRQITVIPDVATVVLNTPAPGSTVNAPSTITFTYFAGNNGPMQATCFARIGQTFATDPTTFTDGVPKAVPYNYVAGLNSILLHCDGANGFSVEAPYSFTVAQGSVVEPTVILASPADGFVSNGDSAVTFQYTYNANRYASQYPMTSCNINFYSAMPPGGQLISTTGYVNAQTGILQSASVPVPQSAKYWAVACGVANSTARSISWGAANNNNNNNNGGGSSGGSTGNYGTGGASFAVPRPSTKPTVIETNKTLGGIPSPINTTIGGIINALERIFMTVPANGTVDNPIALLLKNTDGKPISAAEVYVRVPDSKLSIRIVTDSLGKAVFTPAAAGMYSFRVAGYDLAGDPSVSVSDKPAATPTAPEKPTNTGMDLGSLLPIILIFIAVVALIVVMVGGYSVLKPKEGEGEDELGN